MGRYTYPIILVGAAALALVLYKRNAFGAVPVQCEPQAKSEAKRWMEEVLAYKKPEMVEQNTIDQATGMDQSRLIDYADLLRGRQEQPNMEYFRANGIGRPM